MSYVTGTKEQLEAYNEQINRHLQLPKNNTSRWARIIKRGNAYYLPEYPNLAAENLQKIEHLPEILEEDEQNKTDRTRYPD